MHTIFKYQIINSKSVIPIDAHIIRIDHVDDGFYKGDFIWAIVDTDQTQMVDFEWDGVKFGTITHDPTNKLCGYEQIRVKEKLQNFERKYFFDPIHSTPHYPNTFSFMKKSDLDFFSKCAERLRDGKADDHLHGLSKDEIDMVYCYSDSVLYNTVDDYIFEDDMKIYEYMLSKYRIIGERCGWGDQPNERKDFLGNVLTFINYRYFSSSWVRIGEKYFLSREVLLENNSFCDNILFFNKKDKRRILFQIQEDEYNEHLDMLNDNDYGDGRDFVPTVRFVENLDSNKQVIESLEDFINEDFEWGDEEFVRALERSYLIVGYSNPIDKNFLINC